MVKTSVFVRPNRSASTPNNTPPTAQPMRKIEKMMPPYQPIASWETAAAGLGAQQIVQRGMEHQGVDGGVHGIEHPPEPGDEQNQPLVARNAVTPGGRLHELEAYLK